MKTFQSEANCPLAQRSAGGGGPQVSKLEQIQEDGDGDWVSHVDRQTDTIENLTKNKWM